MSAKPGREPPTDLTQLLLAAPEVVLPAYYGPNVGNVVTIDTLGTGSFQIKTTTLTASTTYQVQYLVIP